MTKVIMHGCNGKMGQMITGLIAADDEIEIVAGVDAFETGNNTYPVFKSIGLCDIGADVVIDFSNAQAIDGLLDYCMEKKLPCVLCTTGLSEAQLQKVEEAGEKTAVLKSANMSLGINLLLKLLKDAAGILLPQGLILRSWRSTTTRRWMRQAERHWPWRIPSTRNWTMLMSISMTGAAGGKRGR